MIIMAMIQSWTPRNISLGVQHLKGCLEEVSLTNLGETCCSGQCNALVNADLDPVRNYWEFPLLKGYDTRSMAPSIDQEFSDE
jgi:hypothetical protein